MKISKDIADYSLQAFVARVLEAAEQGWTIDEWNPPQQLGPMFVTNMLRDEEVIDPPTPMSRAEVLAKARAAKKAKAEAPAEGPETAQDATEDAARGQGSSEAASEAPEAVPVNDSAA